MDKPQLLPGYHEPFAIVADDDHTAWIIGFDLLPTFWIAQSDYLLDCRPQTLGVRRHCADHFDSTPYLFVVSLANSLKWILY